MVVKSLRRFALAGSFMTATLAIGGFTSPALAQANEEVSYIAVVKGNDIYVRCGAAESYYPFTKINAGDMVKVTGEKFEWARIATVGPAFKYGFGYVKYTKGDAGRFRLAPDGKSGVTLGKTDIVAPNLESKDSKTNYKDSWKAIARMEPNQTLRVLETIEFDRDVIHKVALPDSATGWVSKAYLEQASESQQAEWKSLLAQSQSPTEMKPLNRDTPTRPMIDQSLPAGASVKPVSSKTEPTIPQHASASPTDDTLAMAQPGIDGVSTAPENAAAEKPVEPKLPTLDDLEGMFKQLQGEPLETSEVQPLRELYVDLGKRHPSDQRIQRYSKGRAEQLQIICDLQKKRVELQEFRTKAKMTAAETEAVAKALESSAQYVAVGRVAASTIYDGERLPKLLRLQDAGTGRTVAYLKPDEKYQVVNLIGNLVGIIGEKSYDEQLRLNIVKPRRIDILTPEEDQQPADAEKTASVVSP